MSLGEKIVQSQPRKKMRMEMGLGLRLELELGLGLENGMGKFQISMFVPISMILVNRKCKAIA